MTSTTDLSSIDMTPYRPMTPWADSNLRRIAASHGCTLRTGTDLRGRLMFRFVTTEGADVYAALRAAVASPDQLTF